VSEDLTPLEDAQRLIFARCPPLHPRAIPLEDALGCVTSVAVVADRPVPPFANSAMDGYAVKAADTTGATDTPVTLAVVDTIAAGATPTATLATGQTSRIMTGAPLPAGADAIVMVERTAPGSAPDTVVITQTVEPGTHVRPAGDDIRAGDEVFPPGTTLRPGHLGVLANLGLRKVPVFPRPSVGVLSTGDELVNGQIGDSNRPTLLALCREAGFAPIDLGTVGDDQDVIEQALDKGIEACDAVLTTGGVSAGDFDYVKKLLDTQLRIAIKPAKPLAFGTPEDTPVFGLPGNPVSAMVSFELFARPALKQMAGVIGDGRFRTRVTAIADEPFKRRPDGKTHFVRVVAVDDDIGARWHVRSAGGQGSHQLLGMARANALAVIPDGDGVSTGDGVTVMLL
jgi:molybdenum cofactor synthesis domain-containing protein